MKKSIYLSLITVLFFSCDKPNEYFPRIMINEVYGGSMNEMANSVIANTSDEIVMAGLSYSNDDDVSGNHGGEDAWVIKIDKSGKKLWQKTLGGDGNDWAKCIISAIDGGYMVLGGTGDYKGDASGYSGRGMAWLAKLDDDGNLVWQKTIEGSGQDFASSIIAGSDGGYIVTGGTQNGKNNFDAWVVKLDNDGNVLWKKTYGGSGDDCAYSITKSQNGGYLFTGTAASYDGDVSNNYGNLDMWVVNLDNNGNIIWEKSFGGSDDDRGSSVTMGTDGNYVITGCTKSSDFDVVGFHGSTDAWVVKLDNDGNILWQKPLGGSGAERGNEISATKDGGYMVAAAASSHDGDVTGVHGGGNSDETYSDAWIVKLDENGNIVWTKALGGAGQDEANAIVKRFGGTYVMAGYTDSNNGDVKQGTHGVSDFWVVTPKER